MGRALKRDMPGRDWRVTPEELGERGLDSVFGEDFPRPLPLVVDLGFGRGEFVMALAEKAPQTPFLAVEYSTKRVHKMARRLARTEVENVRLVHGRAEAVVEEQLLDGCVERFWINFPDPWPKKRHHRRRLVQPAFVRELVRCLATGGRLELATDHEGYAEHVHEVLAAEPGLENRNAPAAFLAEATDRPATAYELAWRAQGRRFHFFSYGKAPAEG
jgi:tRNA (guanine-N7-)-methyltransferase